MTAQLSELDSDRFGIRVGRVATFGPEDVPSLLEWCRGQGVQLLIARCPAGDVSAVHAMQRSGGLLMETLVYWERDLRSRPFEPGPEKKPVRPATPADLPRLEEIARRSFTGYFGHYHSDPRLDARVATEGYVDWASRSLRATGTGSVVLLGEQGGQAMGFGVFVLRPGDACELTLTGVHPDAQGRGLYRSIMTAGIGWASAARCATLFSSTPVTNVPGQKVWAGLGLVPRSASHTFHLWI